MSLTGQRIGHIRIESQLGAGGMGEVYAGYDEKLRRKVAIKAIHARHRLSAEVKARFLQEARLLSQLEHPHICRIHDYVEHEDSELLILEFIDGRPLTGKLAQGLDRKTKLRIAEDLAEVLAAAHTAGVVHRDLKPENVLLTADGEIKVLDFGLAHSDVGLELDELASELQRDPRAAAEEAVHAAMLRTEIGSVLGTPAYMSPEQARGEEVSTASDCYSLGLFLQELFSGRPPVLEGEDIGSVLGRAKRGERLPPEGLDADVLRLVERLTELAPAARATALDARERIRWLRARPRRVLRRSAVAAAVVVAVSAWIKYTLDLDHERGLAVAAQGEEKEARIEAELRQGQAEGLLSFLIDEARPELEKVGRLLALEGAANRVVEYFDTVPAALLTAEERSRRAQAHALLADIEVQKGNLPAAWEAARESLEAAADIAEDAAGDAALEERRRRADALIQEGTAHFYNQNLDAALEPFGQSLTSSRMVVEAHGDDLFRLGQAEFWVAYVHYLQQEYDAAEQGLRAYLHLAEQLVRIDPTNDEWQLEVAYGHSNLGSLHEARGDLGAALAAFERSHAIRERVIEGDPDNVPWQMKLGISHNKLGQLLSTMVELHAAHDHYRRDLEIRTELVRHDPRNPEWQFLLATSHNALGGVLRDLGRSGDARRQFEAQLGIMADLLAQQPGHRRWMRDTAIARLKNARVLWAEGRARDALPMAERATEELAVAVANLSPASVEGLDHAWARSTLALIRARAQDPELALDEALAIVAELEAVETQENYTLHETLVECEYDLGLIWEELGEPERARASWLGVVERFRNHLGEPNTLGLRVLRCSARIRIGDLEEAREDYQRLLAGGFARPDFMELCEAHGLVD